MKKAEEGIVEALHMCFCLQPLYKSIHREFSRLALFSPHAPYLSPWIKIPQKYQTFNRCLPVCSEQIYCFHNEDRYPWELWHAFMDLTLNPLTSYRKAENLPVCLKCFTSQLITLYILIMFPSFRFLWDHFPSPDQNKKLVQMFNRSSATNLINLLRSTIWC